MVQWIQSVQFFSFLCGFCFGPVRVGIRHLMVIAERETPLFFQIKGRRDTAKRLDAEAQCFQAPCCIVRPAAGESCCWPLDERAVCVKERPNDSGGPCRKRRHSIVPPRRRVDLAECQTLQAIEHGEQTTAKIGAIA